MQVILGNCRNVCHLRVLQNVGHFKDLKESRSFKGIAGISRGHFQGTAGIWSFQGTAGIQSFQGTAGIQVILGNCRNLDHFRELQESRSLKGTAGIQIILTFDLMTTLDINFKTMMHFKDNDSPFASQFFLHLSLVGSKCTID